MEVMGCQVHAIRKAIRPQHSIINWWNLKVPITQEFGKAIRPLFTDLVTYDFRTATVTDSSGVSA